MNILGKILGSTAGFVLGGPLGALLGIAAGGVVDSMRARTHESNRASSHGYDHNIEDRPLAFTLAVIALSAKLARADGKVDDDEIALINRLKHHFPIARESEPLIKRIFDEALKEDHSFEPYAQQIKEIFHTEPHLRDEPNLLETLMAALFRIALVDGVYHHKERDYLQRVAEILGFNEADFHRMERLWGQASYEKSTGRTEEHSSKTDPYATLGIAHDASHEDIKRSWREKARTYHPDNLAAHGLPREFTELANQKMAEINQAYEMIRKQRGIK